MSGYPGSYGYDPTGGSSSYGNSPQGRGDDGKTKTFLFATAASSGLGAVFAALSTSDFVAHLDRNVHSIHCSFNPGSTTIGESGCKTVMMSPYSSLFRESMWGGLPISLLALAVFSFIAARAASFAVSQQATRRETAFVFTATLLPLLMSVIYGTISVTSIGAVCTICVGIYLSSTLSVILAFLAHRAASPASSHDNMPSWATWFGIGCAYVVGMTILYVGMAPSDENPAKGCSTLVDKKDPNDIMIKLGDGKSDSIAVLDPLCPACKGFDERLEASGLKSKLSLQTVLFPLDASCNWMVKESLHPGACLISEAMLCDKSHAGEILAWAFADQETLKSLGKDDPAALKRKIIDAFPSTKGCVGSATAKNKVNKSLRWAVKNALPVLTPQLFVGDQRVCDEDTDLGLEYTVAAMIKAERGGKR